jgi:tRNA threonylcarbamoyl adenosine modification protein YjeE
LVAFAASFARRLHAGDVVAISGPLGSGKTTFVRAIVQALHHADQTSSPTFTFWHRYEGRPTIDHIDLFRVTDPKEVSELGLEEAFGADSIALVEWWRNAPFLLPERRYEVDIDGSGDGARTVNLREPV